MASAGCVAGSGMRNQFMSIEYSIGIHALVEPAIQVSDMCAYDSTGQRDHLDV